MSLQSQTAELTGLCTAIIIGALENLSPKKKKYWLACPENLDRSLSTALESAPEILELEPRNFRVPSQGWERKTIVNFSGKLIEFLESPTGDIWEIVGCEKHPEICGEQLFTWEAAVRETKKAGKRMPTDGEWSLVAQTAKDIPNIIFTGSRLPNGLFHFLGSIAYFWSSTAKNELLVWSRSTVISFLSVSRDANSKDYGFSVRCLQE